MRYNFRGFIAPVFTPFNERLELKLSVIAPYANNLKQRGVLGVLVNGTTGEGVSLNITERKLVTEAWVDAVKVTKQSLMVQIGGTSLTDIVDLAKHSENRKVDALLCLPELFFKPKTNKELVDYLKLVSSAAPNTPLLYYHIPSFTDVNLDMEELIKLAFIEIPTFAGIKFTHTNLEEGARCVYAGKKRDLGIFLGADQLLSAATILGFDSAIATTLNLWPNLLNEIQGNVKTGSIEEAMELQCELTRKINSISKHGSWVSTMKAAMNSTNTINMGKPRPPLVPMNFSQIQEISSVISQ